jgi:asparagine synthase (glutamine-hydrolysing)
MCGIVGIVSFDEQRRVSPERVTAMRDALAHGGPDGEGLMVERGVGLGHRRLAIVDLAGGHQPMTGEDRRTWVVFNGEIYNHAALRPDLIERGHRYQTRSDTETLVHLHEEHGDAAVERLRGMFAYAVWDAVDRRILLARDRLGIKPLYYVIRDHELLFASEIKALVAAGLRPEFDPDVLPEYLASRYVTGERTFFRDVRALPPGHLLTWSADEGIRTSRYWHVPPVQPDDGSSMTTRARVFLDELDAAVERHLMSDVPLGVFLSGGIDSSAIAALAASHVDEPINTFSVGFREAEGNELPYARMVAGAIGSRHHEVTVSADEYFAALPALVWAQDGPMAFSSGVPLYFVSRLAREHVKVVLTGEGADELLLGYNRHRVSYWNTRLGGVYSSAVPSAVRARVRTWMKRLPASARRYGDRTFLALDGSTRSVVFDNFAVFPHRLQRSVLREMPADADPYRIGLQYFDETPGGVCERLSAADLQTYLCELLMKQDRMSMAASIESRVPFLDDDLVTSVATMPSRFKLRGWTSKAVLRRAAERLLPADILTRKKMGFPVPLDRWLRTSHWPIVEEFVLSPRACSRNLFDRAEVRRLADEHRAGAARHGERLWLLITLEIWQRLFCDGEPADALMRPANGRTRHLHAYRVDEDGWALAAQHGRPAAKLPDPVVAGAAASDDGRHDARP